MDRRVVAIVGAECSGKSTLARALGESLPATVVPEQLRMFVAEHGRVPMPAEQAGLLQRQIAAADEAPPGWVVSDGGALMTAVYSLVYYDDPSLVADAVAYHRLRCSATVWCGVEIPWRPDPGQRDGAEYRARADGLIAQIVQQHGLSVLRVRGSVPQRLAAVRGSLLARG